MALTVQTNTKKYCSYLYNNIDFYNKMVQFSYVLYLPIYVLFCHFMLFNAHRLAVQETS